MQQEIQSAQLQLIFQAKEQIQQFITENRYPELNKFQYNIINDQILVYNGQFEHIFKSFCMLKHFHEAGKIQCLDISIAVIDQNQMLNNAEKVFNNLGSKQDEIKALEDNELSRQILRAKMQANQAFRNIIDHLQVREK